ncbi:hypothetical protein DL98DRAFT_565769 [Cadophora sp. DSE1049]|nr:hypothetical protein DL98DRAFT_565769 [Cadophora sp. DSE1049]
MPISRATLKRKHKNPASGFARSVDAVNDTSWNSTNSPESSQQELSNDSSSTFQGSQSSEQTLDFLSAHRNSTCPSTPPTPTRANQPTLQPHPQPLRQTAAWTKLLKLLGVKSPLFPAVKSKKSHLFKSSTDHRATGRRLAEREDNERRSLRGLPSDKSVHKATSFYRNIKRTASFDTAPKTPQQSVWGYVQPRLSRRERFTVTERRRFMTWTWKEAGKTSHKEERPVSPGGTEYEY